MFEEIPVFVSNNIDAPVSRLIAHAIECGVKYNCCYCGELLLESDKNQPWCDLYCTSCCEPFELKTFKTLKVWQGYKHGGGSYREYLSLDVLPTLICVAYGTEYHDDQILIKINQVTYYPPDSYMVFANDIGTKSTIKICENSRYAINLSTSFCFIIDCYDYENNMTVVDEHGEEAYFSLYLGPKLQVGIPIETC